MDRRRFRANIYADARRRGRVRRGRDLIGRKCASGHDAVIAVLERDPRCKILSLDPGPPSTTPTCSAPSPANTLHAQGVYCAVLVEGIIRNGDTLTLLD